MKKYLWMVGLLIFTACTNIPARYFSADVKRPVEAFPILLVDHSAFYFKDPLVPKDINAQNFTAYSSYVNDYRGGGVAINKNTEASIKRTPKDLSLMQYDVAGKSSSVALEMSPVEAFLNAGAANLDVGKNSLIGTATVVARRLGLEKSLKEQFPAVDLIRFFKAAVDDSNFSKTFATKNNEEPILWSIDKDFYNDIFIYRVTPDSGLTLAKYYPLPEEAKDYKYGVMIKLGSAIAGQKKGLFGGAIVTNPVSIAVFETASRDIVYNRIMFTEAVALPADKKLAAYDTVRFDEYYANNLQTEVTRILNEFFSDKGLYGN